MTRKKYKILLRGGDLIGQGAFKTVVRPGIECKNKNFVSKVFTGLPKNKNYISAIFVGSNAELNRQIELKLLDKISSIDPDETFSINKYQKCCVPSSIPELSRYKSDKKSYPQILLSYGGRDLDSIIKDDSIKYQLNDIIYLIGNFMVGFSILQENKLIHNDIKDLNMLMSENNDKLYLIDYGLSMLNKDLYKTENKNLFQYVYPTYPPEYQLISAILELKPSNYENIVGMLENKNYLISKLLLNIKSNYVESMIFEEDKNSYSQEIEFFIDQTKKYIIEKKDELFQLNCEDIVKKIFGLYWDRIDIYSLGCVFSLFLITKTDKSKNYNTRVYNLLYDLFSDMKLINPSNRSTTLNVIKRLESINNKFYLSGGNFVGIQNNNNNSSRKLSNSLKKKIEENYILENISTPSVILSDNVRKKQIENIISEV